MAAPLDVLMLGFPGAQLLDVTGPLQVFASANAEHARQAYRASLARAFAGSGP